MNSMAIKNEYLRHHSKFLSENIKFFDNDHEDPKHIKKYNKIKNQSYDNLSTEALKSKFLYMNTPRLEPKPSKRISKEFKTNNSFEKKLNQSKQLKDKIKIIH